MPKLIWPETDLPPLSPAGQALSRHLTAPAEPSPIFDGMQLRGVEIDAEQSLTAALAALQSGDRDQAVLHMVAALEFTERADRLEQKETL